MKMIKFYDTCSLLKADENIFEEKFAISSITLEELESIKTSIHKDQETKYQARKLLALLDKHMWEYDIVIFKLNMLKHIEDLLPINNDTKILACAIEYDKTQHPDETIFITNDLSLKAMASLFFGEDSIISIAEEEDDYCGYISVNMSNDELADFYSHPNENTLNLQINQYVIIHNDAGEIVDKLCWTGEGYRNLSYQNLNSKWFGEVKPLKGDVYQALAVDSLFNNKLTMLRGRAGSGKSYLALSFLLNRLEKGKIDKIIVFCNTIATKNSARLGYYPGSKDEKLLDSQIGNMLSSKFGGRIEVERMIQEEKLLLLPMSDIRGYDTSGMRAGIYISEAQNLDIVLMKLALQRIGEDSICIIDGDDKTQVDDIAFAGDNNGMRRVSKIFRNNNIYGEIELKNIHRSQIARLAEKL